MGLTDAAYGVEFSCEFDLGEGSRVAPAAAVTARFAGTSGFGLGEGSVLFAWR
jgi:hypothetical protein